jgi:hypothetical protein
MKIRQEVLKAGALGGLVTIGAIVLIVIGSRNLAHFDAALVGYTFAVLFATFGITDGDLLAAGVADVFQAGTPPLQREKLVAAGGAGYRAEPVHTAP